MNASAKMFNLKKYIFQNDNYPKDTSKHLKEYLADRKLFVLDWAAQSPHINPIEFFLKI